MINILNLAPICWKDLKRNPSPKTNPTKPLKARKVIWENVICKSKFNKKMVELKYINARISLVILTVTDPTRIEASVKAMDVPDQRNAVTNAASSPK